MRRALEFRPSTLKTPASFRRGCLRDDGHKRACAAITVIVPFILHRWSEILKKTPQTSDREEGTIKFGHGGVPSMDNCVLSGTHECCAELQAMKAMKALKASRVGFRTCTASSERYLSLVTDSQVLSSDDKPP